MTHKIDTNLDLPRHGSAADRGAADAYYGRAMEPHYFEGGTYCSPRRTDLTNQELMEYFLAITIVQIERIGDDLECDEIR